MALKIYTNNKFKGHWPVGTAAVVIARNPEDAAMFLSKELALHGLEPVKASDMNVMLFNEGTTKILCDGNY